MDKLRLGTDSHKPREFQEIENVDEVRITETGALFIEHHDNQITCYASGVWRWFYFYPEEKET